MQQAMAFHQAGDLARAERCYREILRVEPNEFDALHYLGLLQAQAGHYEEALRLISKALGINARSIEAHTNRGNVLTALNRHEEALASFDSALAITPDSALVHYNRGNALMALGRHEQALASYARVLAMMPDNVQALYNRAIALQSLERYEEASAVYAKVLALMPDNAAAHYNRGLALQRLRRYSEALKSYQSALALVPDDVEVLTNHGIVLHELDRAEEALASYDRALAIAPDFVEALNNRGNVLRQLNRPAEALASCDRALAAKPDHLEAWNNRGLALQSLNRNVEALASYERALRINPDHADANWLRCLCRLLLGDFERGWKEYEWRWDNYVSARRTFSRPLWLGREDIRGKTILLYGEQGLGDTIQFARYVEMAAQRGAHVILEVQRPLKGLLSGLRGAQQVLRSGDPLPEFDYQCPLLSLPLAFGTTVATVPSRVPYLAAAPELVATWHARLGRSPGRNDFKIGICWQGLPVKRVDWGRSIPLREFFPLSQLQGVRLISLQKNYGLDQLDGLPAGMKVEMLGDEFDAGENAFVDTAAVMENLDLIITCDTSVAHLAGALGRPVWLALKYAPDWRWMLDRNDSPWYPSMRIFRQSAAEDWRGVFEAMRRELEHLVSSRLSSATKDA
jgi:tetratricopeptide (TPR) repeat protein